MMWSSTLGRLRSAVAASMIVIAATSLIPVASAGTVSPKTKRVSVGTDGAEPNAASYWSSLSANGRFVAFESSASNLVANDTNGTEDVFVRDRRTGTTNRVSVNSAGVEGDQGSALAAISATGRFVVFRSGATNLVKLDTNGVADVFIRDRKLGITRRVSLRSNGAEGNSYSDNPSVSQDGRFVAFASNATNLVPGDDNASRDIFLHDRKTGRTRILSRNRQGSPSNGNSFWPYISSDGRSVVFQSDATDLVAGDTNAVPDIFVHRTATGVTRRVSVRSSGIQANAYSNDARISADGRFVVFASTASNLVGNDENAQRDIFVHDRATGTTTRVSLSSAGAEADGQSDVPSISSDGRLVSFRSDATNLVGGDTNLVSDVFVHDRTRDRTRRASVNSVFTEGNDLSYDPSISADGRWVVFNSRATNLIASDANAAEDIFVRGPLRRP